MFCDTWRYQVQCDGWPAHYTKGLFPWVHPIMPKLVEQVCLCRRNVPREWLDWKALHFSYLSFMAEFWELSNMNMYMDIFWLIYVSEQSTQIWNSMWTYSGEIFFTSSVVCEGTSCSLPWPKGLFQFFVSKLQDRTVWLIACFGKRQVWHREGTSAWG